MRALVIAAALLAQAQMPNPKQMSGVPLPVNDIPAGTISVRVIRGNFVEDLANQPVEFTIDGATRQVKTDAGGRAQVAGLKPGTRVKAATVVSGEKLESQEIAMGAAGIRVMLVANDPNEAKRADEDRKLAAAPPVKGQVTLGSETRLAVEINDDNLDIFYVIEIVNSARTPVDIGGPLIFDMPAGARGTTVLQGSTEKATANGTRVIVMGPFPPGSTTVQTVFDLPLRAETEHLEQRFPAALAQVTVLATKIGGIGLSSPQFTRVQQATADSGQQILVASGGALGAGQPLRFDVTGLPHHPTWPRYLALALAGVIGGLGAWSAVTARRASPAA